MKEDPNNTKSKIGIGLVLILLIVITGAAITNFTGKLLQERKPDTESFVESEAINDHDPDQAYLRSVNTEGFGIAKRIYASGKFIHTVNATLPDLAGEEIYQGWLMKEDNPGSFISTGELIYLDNDRFLFFQSDSDLTSLNKVMITRQLKGSSLPGEPVLEGRF